MPEQQATHTAYTAIGLLAVACMEGLQLSSYTYRPSACSMLASAVCCGLMLLLLLWAGPLPCLG
jgi:hypothetical protein